jgi:hypothetical protein
VKLSPKWKALFEQCVEFKPVNPRQLLQKISCDYKPVNPRRQRLQTSKTAAAAAEIQLEIFFFVI